MSTQTLTRLIVQQHDFAKARLAELLDTKARAYYLGQLNITTELLASIKLTEQEIMK